MMNKFLEKNVAGFNNDNLMKAGGMLVAGIAVVFGLKGLTETTEKK